MEAERSSAYTRLCVSLSFCVFLCAVAVFASGRLNVWIVGVCFAHVALSILGVILTSGRHFRPWFSLIICATDALFVFSVGMFGPWLHILPEGWAFALVSQWAVFLILVIEALRARVTTIIFQTLVVGVLLCILVWGNPDPYQAPPSFPLAPLFSDSANLARIAVVVLTGCVLAYGASRSRTSLRRAVQTAAERAMFQRFHPKELAEKISSNDMERLKQGGRHTVSVLVADLRNFTAMAEALPPERVVLLLNSFRTRTESVIRHHGGSIDKFVGDSVLAVFGIGGASERDASNAIAAGVALAEEMRRWSSKRVKEGRTAISVGIGLHCGEAFVGAVGSDRMEFTVIGDVVNVAHRLEAMTRDTACEVLASRDILEAATVNPKVETGWALFPSLIVRGRAEGITAYGRS